MVNSQRAARAILPCCTTSTAKTQQENDKFAKECYKFAVMLVRVVKGLSQTGMKCLHLRSIKKLLQESVSAAV